MGRLVGILLMRNDRFMNHQVGRETWSSKAEQEIKWEWIRIRDGLQSKFVCVQRRMEAAQNLQDGYRGWSRP